MMSTVSAELAPDRDAAYGMSVRRMLRSYICEAKFESLRTLRVPMFAAPIVAFPIILYVLFGILIPGRAAPPELAARQFVHWATFSSIAPGMLGFGITLAFERQFGMLSFKRAVPMPPAAYLLSKMLMSILAVVLVMVVLIAIGTTIGKVRLPFGDFLELAVIDTLGTLPFCAIGLFIGAWVNAQAAPAIVNAVYLPMSLLAGVFFPLPHTIAFMAYLSPMFFLDRLGLIAIGEKALPNSSECLAILAAVTLALSAASIRRLVRHG